MGMVGVGASMVGGWPRSRRVWLVMGPMEARTMSGGSVRLAACIRAMRLRAVDALVKVMASGWCSDELKRCWRAGMDSAGMLLQ